MSANNNDFLFGTIQQILEDESFVEDLGELNKDWYQLLVDNVKVSDDACNSKASYSLLDISSNEDEEIVDEDISLTQAYISHIESEQQNLSAKLDSIPTSSTPKKKMKSANHFHKSFYDNYSWNQSPNLSEGFTATSSCRSKSFGQFTNHHKDNNSLKSQVSARRFSLDGNYHSKCLQPYQNVVQKHVSRHQESHQVIVSNKRKNFKHLSCDDKSLKLSKVNLSLPCEVDFKSPQQVFKVKSDDFNPERHGFQSLSSKNKSNFCEKKIINSKKHKKVFSETQNCKQSFHFSTEVTKDKKDLTLNEETKKDFCKRLNLSSQKDSKKNEILSEVSADNLQVKDVAVDPTIYFQKQTTEDSEKDELLDLTMTQIDRVFNNSQEDLLNVENIENKTTKLKVVDKENRDFDEDKKICGRKCFDDLNKFEVGFKTASNKLLKVKKQSIKKANLLFESLVDKLESSKSINNITRNDKVEETSNISNKSTTSFNDILTSKTDHLVSRKGVKRSNQLICHQNMKRSSRELTTESRCHKNFDSKVMKTGFETASKKVVCVKVESLQSVESLIFDSNDSVNDKRLLVDGHKNSESSSEVENNNLSLDKKDLTLNEETKKDFCKRLNLSSQKDSKQIDVLSKVSADNLQVKDVAVDPTISSQKQTKEDSEKDELLDLTMTQIDRVFNNSQEDLLNVENIENKTTKLKVVDKENRDFDEDKKICGRKCFDDPNKFEVGFKTASNKLLKVKKQSIKKANLLFESLVDKLESSKSINNITRNDKVEETSNILNKSTTSSNDILTSKTDHLVSRKGVKRSNQLICHQNMKRSSRELTTESRCHKNIDSKVIKTGFETASKKVVCVKVESLQSVESLIFDSNDSVNDKRLLVDGHKNSESSSEVENNNLSLDKKDLTLNEETKKDFCKSLNLSSQKDSKKNEILSEVSADNLQVKDVAVDPTICFQKQTKEDPEKDELLDLTMTQIDRVFNNSQEDLLNVENIENKTTKLKVVDKENRDFDEDKKICGRKCFDDLNKFEVGFKTASNKLLKVKKQSIKKANLLFESLVDKLESSKSINNITRNDKVEETSNILNKSTTSSNDILTSKTDHLVSRKGVKRSNQLICHQNMKRSSRELTTESRCHKNIDSKVIKTGFETASKKVVCVKVESLQSVESLIFDSNDSVNDKRLLVDGHKNSESSSEVENNNLSLDKKDLTLNEETKKDFCKSLNLSSQKDSKKNEILSEVSADNLQVKDVAVDPTICFQKQTKEDPEKDELLDLTMTQIDRVFNNSQEDLLNVENIENKTTKLKVVDKENRDFDEDKKICGRKCFDDLNKFEVGFKTASNKLLKVKKQSIKKANLLFESLVDKLESSKSINNITRNDKVEETSNISNKSTTSSNDILTSKTDHLVSRKGVKRSNQLICHQNMKCSSRELTTESRCHKNIDSKVIKTGFETASKKVVCVKVESLQSVESLIFDSNDSVNDKRLLVDGHKNSESSSEVENNNLSLDKKDLTLNEETKKDFCKSLNLSSQKDSKKNEILSEVSADNLQVKDVAVDPTICFQKQTKEDPEKDELLDLTMTQIDRVFNNSQEDLLNVENIENKTTKLKVVDKENRDFDEDKKICGRKCFDDLNKFEVGFKTASNKLLKVKKQSIKKANLLFESLVDKLESSKSINNITRNDKVEETSNISNKSTTSSNDILTSKTDHLVSRKGVKRSNQLICHQNMKCSSRELTTESRCHKNIDSKVIKTGFETASKKVVCVKVESLQSVESLIFDSNESVNDKRLLVDGHKNSESSSEVEDVNNERFFVDKSESLVNQKIIPKSIKEKRKRGYKPPRRLDGKTSLVPTISSRRYLGFKRSSQNQISVSNSSLQKTASLFKDE